MHTPHAFFRTHSGRMVNLADVLPEDLDPGDIAHRLARVCRFGGATRRVYSVAQHCVYVARNIVTQDVRIQRAALLHDAAEAYIGDMTSGLKRLCPDYKRVEAQVERAIVARFGLSVGLDYPAIKEADLRARLSEARDLFDAYPRAQLLGGEDGLYPYAAHCDDTLSFDAAELEFLHHAHSLGLE